MAAGLGYIEFNTGDVLTAAQANGYLASQVVMVFASAAARTSAIASPQEGMISYLKDTNATEYYSGSAWVAIGGGGSDSHTLIATASLSGATAIQFASIPTTYTHLYCVFIDCNSTSSYWNVRFNNDSGNNYNSQATAAATVSGNSSVGFAGVGDQNARLGIIPVTLNASSNGTANGSMQIFNYKSTTLKRAGIWQSTGYDGSAYFANSGSFCYNSTGTAITQIDFVRGSTQTITGTIQLWGVK